MPIGGATKYNGTMTALFAIAAMGGKFYDAFGLKFGEARSKSLFEHTRDYHHPIRDAVVASLDEARESEAFYIEPVWRSGTGRGEKYGYRLCRMAKTGGDRYSGEVFPSWEHFWRAMRTLEDVSRIMRPEDS